MAAMHGLNTNLFTRDLHHNFMKEQGAERKHHDTRDSCEKWVSTNLPVHLPSRGAVPTFAIPSTKPHGHTSIQTQTGRQQNSRTPRQTRLWRWALDKSKKKSQGAQITLHATDLGLGEHMSRYASQKTHATSTLSGERSRYWESTHSNHDPYHSSSTPDLVDAEHALASHRPGRCWSNSQCLQVLGTHGNALTTPGPPPSTQDAASPTTHAPLHGRL